MKPKYTPSEIPKNVSELIYTHYSLSKYSYGELYHTTYDASGEDYVLIAQTPIKIHIPPVGDLKDKVVASLEKEKQKQMAEHHKKMFELQEKIDSLLCLTYQPKDIVIEEPSNVLPF